MLYSAVSFLARFPSDYANSGVPFPVIDDVSLTNASLKLGEVYIYLLAYTYCRFVSNVCWSTLKTIHVPILIRQNRL